MKKNTLVLSTTFLMIFTTKSLCAVTRNVCDDYVELKKSDDQIQKCIAARGESETYKQNLQKKKWLDSKEALKETEDAAKKANIETKKFSEKDIEDALGMPIFAYKIDYSKIVTGEPKRLTKGDTLCKFLGFEKSLKSSFSGFIEAVDAYENGIVIDDYWIGGGPKEPEVFKDKSITHYILKFKEITCAKVISKDVPGTSDLLKEVAEDIGSLSPGFIEGKTMKKDDVEVDDSQRKEKIKNPGKTPYGYERKKEGVTK